MDFNNYQFQANATAIYRERKLGSIIYPLLKLAGEAGEIDEKFGKLIRDKDWDGTYEDITEEDRQLILKEMGDVLWYIAVLSTDMKVNMSQVAQMNLDKLSDRAERGVIGGSGDER